jgi:hypothetical protein
MRPFTDDMRALADSHLTRYTETSTGGRLDRTWIAADMSVDASGDFMTGVLGFAVVGQVRSFDEQTWSWTKGETTELHGAPSATTVPFAVDLREERRWVAFATSNNIRQVNFGRGLESVLNQAVTELGLWPTNWEFDLVLSRGTVRQWISEHPQVFRLVRKLSFNNPGINLDAERAAMRALGADRMREEYSAPRSGLLNTDADEFERKLEGVESGDAAIRVVSRQGSARVEFRSEDHADHATVDEFRDDLVRGMELVLDALRNYRPEGDNDLGEEVS